MMHQEIITAEARHLATPLDTGAMLQAIIDKGITGESVGVLREMMVLHREMRADDAKRAFARAFAALQYDTRPIAATRAIPDKQGNIRSTFAPFEEIMREVGPLLAKHGFSVSFGQKIDGNRIVSVCTLTHCDGHERTNEFAVRSGQGPPGCSEAQIDGGASTFAKRYALCGMLNIVVDHDNDARSEGGTISPDEADALELRVRAVAPDEAQVARLLRLANAQTFQEIRRAGAAALEAQLVRLEGRGNGAHQRPSTPFKPCPAAFDDPGGWRDAMLGEMGERWGGQKAGSAKILDGLIKAAGFDSYVALPAEKRRDAWNALVGGRLDKHAPNR